MPNYRRGRINEEMAKELAVILRTVKDYRVSKSFVSITAVDCTPDLKYAKVYFSAVGAGADRKEITKGLESAAGYIRSRLAESLNLRATPELQFIWDQSMEHGAHINQLLKQVSKDDTDDK